MGIAIIPLIPELGLILGNIVGWVLAYPIKSFSLSGINWFMLLGCLAMFFTLGWLQFLYLSIFFWPYVAGSIVGFIANFGFRYYKEDVFP